LAVQIIEVSNFLIHIAITVCLEQILSFQAAGVDTILSLTVQKQKFMI